MKNKWEQLLAPHTFRYRSETKVFDGRDPFENDYGRLIASPAIRRLQDKTQVFPLEQSDFIRTRLTHSLEVSYIASSIGKSIERILITENKLDEKHFGQISSLLRTAGLIHDLGNPPFGHFGELAIQSFFKDYFKKNIEKLNKVFLSGENIIKEKTIEESIKAERERNDFENFDGNVQTFRILRKLHFFGDEFSYNLTFPSLASIIKYPSNSIDGNKGKNANKIALKKFGYFSSEQEDYNIINEALGLNNNRHPVVYLLEAADDIAYSAADIEDGVKLGILNFEKIRSIFSDNLVQNNDLIVELDQLYNKNKNTLNDRLLLTVQQFRIKTQTRMIEGAIKSFENNYEDIMKGTLESEIIDKSSGKDIRQSFKQLQGIVFDNKNIMQTELAGWEVIYGLLEIFINASESENFKSQGNNKEARLYKNISSSYRYIYENLNRYENPTYNKIQLVVDFICGMTDSYALNLYRKLKGIRL